MFPLDEKFPVSITFFPEQLIVVVEGPKTDFFELPGGNTPAHYGYFVAYKQGKHSPVFVQNSDQVDKAMTHSIKCS
jgi:hypothetical protein